MGSNQLIQSQRDTVIVGGHFEQHLTANPNTDAREGLFPVSSIALDGMHTSAQRFPPPKCHPGTRDAVLGIIANWITSRSSKSMFWLHGTAGVGKSAVVQTTCETFMGADGHVSAAFFFGRGQGKRAQGEFLVPTIAYQLASNIPDCDRRLRKILTKNPHILQQSMRAQFEALIVGAINTKSKWPFRVLGRNLKPVVIAIDGLDECDGGDTQQIIIELLFDMARASKRPLRFLVASRPESQILKMFNRPKISKETKRTPLDDSFKPADAIGLYFQDKFGNIVEENPDLLCRVDKSWPGEEIITILVVAACGQFIFAYLVIAFVQMLNKDPVKQLDIVLDAARNHVAFSPLDALYTQILSNVSDDLQDVLRLTLGCIIVLSEPRTVEDIACLIAVDRSDVRLVLEQLRAVLRADAQTGMLFHLPITFAHTSFRDFLLDNKRSGHYTINQAHWLTSLVYRLLGVPLPDLSILPQAAIKAPGTERIQTFRSLESHFQQCDLEQLFYQLLIGPGSQLRYFASPDAVPCLDPYEFHNNIASAMGHHKEPLFEPLYIEMLDAVPDVHKAVLHGLLHCVISLGNGLTPEVVAGLIQVDQSLVERTLEFLPAMFAVEITISVQPSFRNFLLDLTRPGRYSVQPTTWVIGLMHRFLGLDHFLHSLSFVTFNTTALDFIQNSLSAYLQHCDVEKVFREIWTLVEEKYFWTPPNTSPQDRSKPNPRSESVTSNHNRSERRLSFTEFQRLTSALGIFNRYEEFPADGLYRRMLDHTAIRCTQDHRYPKFAHIPLRLAPNQMSPQFKDMVLGVLGFSVILQEPPDMNFMATLTDSKILEISTVFLNLSAVLSDSRSGRSIPADFRGFLLDRRRSGPWHINPAVWHTRLIVLALTSALSTILHPYNDEGSPQYRDSANVRKYVGQYLSIHSAECDVEQVCQDMGPVVDSALDHFSSEATQKPQSLSQQPVLWQLQELVQYHVSAHRTQDRSEDVASCPEGHLRLLETLRILRGRLTIARLK